MFVHLILEYGHARCTCDLFKVQRKRPLLPAGLSRAAKQLGAGICRAVRYSGTELEQLIAYEDPYNGESVVRIISKGFDIPPAQNAIG